MVIKGTKAVVVGDYSIRYDDPSLEQIQNDKEDEITELTESIRSMQEKNIQSIPMVDVVHIRKPKQLSKEHQMYHEIHHLI